MSHVPKSRDTLSIDSRQSTVSLLPLSGEVSIWTLAYVVLIIRTTSTRSLSENMRCVVTPQNRVRIHADLKIIATLFDDNTRVLWPIMWM